MKKRVAVAASVIAMGLYAGAASAQEATDDTVTGDRGADMAADLLLVRPISLIGTVLGTAGFIVSLPFTLPTGSAGDAGRALVGRPFEYTFNRPLGDFQRCGADRHSCGAW
jgi:hypothetical protein